MFAFFSLYKRRACRFVRRRIGLAVCVPGQGPNADIMCLCLYSA